MRPSIKREMFCRYIRRIQPNKTENFYVSQFASKFVNFKKPFLRKYTKTIYNVIGKRVLHNDLIALQLSYVFYVE